MTLLQSTFGITFLDDPLPRNLVLSGCRVEATQIGELHLFDLNEIETNVEGPKSHDVSLCTDFATSAPFDSGIFHLEQRPGTTEVVATTFGPGVRVIRLSHSNNKQPSESGYTMNESSGFTEQLAQDSSAMAIDSSEFLEENMEERNRPVSEAAGWEYSVAYNLTGHAAGCATVRARADFAATACFDGSVRMFRWPNCASEDPSTSGSSSSSLSTSNPVEIDPIATFTDDPAHSMAPLTQEGVGVCGLDVSSDSHKVVAGSNDMQIKVWDAATGKITLRLTGLHGWPWWLEGLDPELNEVVTGSTDGRVTIWDVRGGVQSAGIDVGLRFSNAVLPVAGVASRVDGRYLVAGCFGHGVHVIDRRMMRELSSIAGHTDRISRVSLREDTALSSSFDGSIGVWNFMC